MRCTLHADKNAVLLYSLQSEEEQAQFQTLLNLILFKITFFLSEVCFKTVQ